MNRCFCYHLYNCTPVTAHEYAFGGSLCRVRQFETVDGLRFCLTIFSLSGYKHLHFPYEEYKLLINRLNAHLSTNVIFSTWGNWNALTVKQHSEIEDGELKIKLGGQHFTIGPLTAIGLVNTSPFAFKKTFTCDNKWDICTCKKCLVFSRQLIYLVFPKQKI